MSIRQEMELLEGEILSPYATHNVNSRGREREEEPCDIRPLFQRDRDRILHSKAFRRLKNKTQVFLTPLGDHYRTRMSHTLEVSQNARTIAKALRMNEDLTEAIALGHDLGHTPFGHAGERALNEVYPGRFRHNEQSVRVVDLLEKDGQGLNLTWEVRDGIRNHQTSLMPHTPEGKIVRLCDKIAYVYHDIDDAIRAEILHEEDIPADLRRTLGQTAKDRLDTMIHNVIISSRNTDEICMSDEIWQALLDLRKFMFQSLYTNPVAKSEEVKAKRMLKMLYEYYTNHFEEIPDKYRRIAERTGDDRGRIICDYISGMTDQYAVTKFSEFFLPKAWEVDGY